MGEPLDNYEQVKQSIYGLRNHCLFTIAWNRITMSTVGVVSKMRLFSDDFPKANLALSLHAPNQIIRKEIVPSSTAFTIRKLMDCITYHIIQTGNRVFIEYIAIGNVNCNKECAIDLCALFKQHSELESHLDKIHINIIPYNTTEIGTKYGFKCASKETILEFQQIIREGGLYCTIRWSTTSGQDIDGSCGQLALTANRNEQKSTDIEDIMSFGGTQKIKRSLKNKNIIKNDSKSNSMIGVFNTFKNRGIFRYKIIQIFFSFLIMITAVSVVFAVIGVEWGMLLQF